MTSKHVKEPVTVPDEANHPKVDPQENALSQPDASQLDEQQPKAKRHHAPEVKLTWKDDEVLGIEICNDFDRFAEATTSQNVITQLVGQLAIVGSPGYPANEKETNFALGFIDSMEPRDATELLLLAQMATIHQCTLTMARRLNHGELLKQQDSAERALNKLARTFAAQTEALRKYRTGGQQKMTVEHVTVSDGGQAIIGPVDTGGGKKK